MSNKSATNTTTPAGAGSAQTLKPLVRAEVIAKHFDVNRRTVQLWADKGHIPSVRVASAIRFDFDEVIAAVKRGAA